MLFKILVKSRFMYSMEIWGWRERKKLEDVQTRSVGIRKMHEKMCNENEPKCTKLA